MVFWTFACTDVGKSGIGIAYRRGMKRNAQLSYHIRYNIKNWIAEMAAIAKAIQIAEEEVARSSIRTNKPAKITIYTESRQALFCLHSNGMRNRPLLKQCVKSGIIAAHKLKSLGINVELR